MTVQARPQRARNWMQPILKSFRFRLAFTLILIAVLAIRLDLGKILRTIADFEPSLALFMLTVNWLAMACFAKRWQSLASGLGFDVPFGLCLRAIWLANFLGQFGPSLVVAEATRFQMLRRKTGKTRLILSQILDRISGQIVLIAMVAGLAPFYDVEFTRRLWPAWSALAALVGLGLLLPRLRKRLGQGSGQDFEQAMKLLGWRHLWGHYGLSVAIQSLLILNFNLAALGIGVREPLAALFLLTPLLFAALTLLPFTISDWGSREAASAILLSPSGLDSETLVSVSVLYGLFHLLAVLPGGIFLLHRTPNENR